MSFSQFAAECFPGAHVMISGSEYVVLGVRTGCVACTEVGGEFTVSTEGVAHLPTVSVTAANYTPQSVWVL